MPAEINSTLRQQHRLGQAREYQIFNNKEIRIVLSGKSNQKSIRVSLLSLGEKSSYHIHFSWGWLLLGMLVGAGLAGYFYAKQQFGFYIGSYESLVVILSGVIVLGCAAKFIFAISRKRIFYSRNSHIPLFDIIVNYPSHREYRRFVDLLHAAIAQARQFWQLSLEQQLAGELRTVRRLVAEGILEQRDYELAKDRVFQLSNKKSRRTSR
jgi:hypothetical protein